MFAVRSLLVLLVLKWIVPTAGNNGSQIPSLVQVESDEDESSLMSINRTSRHYNSHRHHSECAFKCDDGTCLKSHNRCDGSVQCTDASDEKKCKCIDRIASKKICDGYEDCPLGEDEVGCGLGCLEDEFSCSPGKGSSVTSDCIKVSERCNGYVDCLPSLIDESECFRLVNLDTPTRGILSEGILQKNIGGQWHTICKSSGRAEDQLAKKYAKKVCEIIVGSVDEDPTVTTVNSYDVVVHEDILAAYPLVYSKLADKESKFASMEKCSSGKLYNVRCPDPECGWKVNTSEKQYVQPTQETLHNFQTSAEHYVYRRAYNSHGLMAKIVGGHDSEAGDYPFIVGIYRNGSFHCGGSILNKEWILTAAHCTHGYDKFVFEAQVGMIRRNSYSPKEQSRTITEIHVHERYDSKIFLNDIALMKVESPFHLSKWVTTACLATAEQDPTEGIKCTVIGWGDLAEEEGVGPDHLQEVGLPVLPKCLETFTKDTQQICAAVLEGGQDACQGDSGGPLICVDKYGRHIVNGLVSFGRGCARPNQAGVYTRVSAYATWIDGIVNDEDSYSKLLKLPKTCTTKCFRSGGECLFPKNLCDTHVDCLGAEDESNCVFVSRAAGHEDDADENAYEHIKQTDHATAEHVHEYGSAKLCGPSEFQCKTTLSCIPLKLKCNGNYDCTDKTDEKHCECGDIIQNSYPEYICDGIHHCFDGSDELGVDCSQTCKAATGAIRCPLSDTCIPQSAWCDGTVHCPHGLDEIDCIRIVKFKGKLPGPGFLDDKMSRGLQSGYVVIRNNGHSWREACDEDFEGPKQEVVCPYLGLSVLETVLSRKARSPWLLTQSETWRRRRGSGCKQVKIHCGEPNCGERKLYSSSNRTPKSYEVGALPWLALVSVEGDPVCGATIVHKQWLLVPSDCIDNNVRSTVNEYLSATSGFSKTTSIVTSTMEQMRRINAIVKLSDGLSLLRLETSFTSDQFTSPICTTVRIHDDSPTCVYVEVKNGTVYEEDVTYDPSCKESDHHCVKFNTDQHCRHTTLGSVYCTADERSWFLLGYTSECSDDGRLKLKNPFYGSLGHQTKELLNRPVSAVIKAPPCSGTRCSSGTCVGSKYVCDGIAHCPDGLDEKRCQRHYQRLLRAYDDEDYHDHHHGNVTISCPIGHFKCKTTGNCVPISAFCDEVYDCGYDDLTDEPELEFCTCKHYLELAAPETVCDVNGKSRCPDRSDLHGCKCSPDSFVCHYEHGSPKECIHENLVCDSVKDCKNGLDESLCTAVSSSLTHVSMHRTHHTLEGYVLVRVKGSWHPYCSDEWSLELGTNICRFLGYNVLDEVETFNLDELNPHTEEKYGSTEGTHPRLWVMGSHRHEAMGSGPLADVIAETSGEEYSCTVGHVRCSKS